VPVLLRITRNWRAVSGAAQYIDRRGHSHHNGPRFCEARGQISRLLGRGGKTRQERLNERTGRTRIYGIRRRCRRRRPGRSVGGDQAAPARGGGGFRPVGLRDRKGLGSWRSYPVGRGDRPDRPRHAAAGLARDGRAGRHGSDGRSFRLSRTGRRPAHPEHSVPAADEQSRQLHCQPRQCLPLARRTGRRSRCRDLSGFRGRRCALRRGRIGARRRHRRHGRCQGRLAQGQLHARH